MPTTLGGPLWRAYIEHADAVTTHHSRCPVCAAPWDDYCPEGSAFEAARDAALENFLNEPCQ